ncbi:glycine cleavage system protein GcvH [Candidatus Altiarchaeota archaeon]
MKIDKYDMPEDLFYHKEHVWAKIEGETAKVGVTDFTQQMAGEISYVQMPFDGDEVKKDDQVGTIETKKWTGNLYTPLSGTVKATNENLLDDPSIINSDPYGEGWIFELDLSDSKEAESLMQGKDVEAWLKEEIAKHA